MRVEAAVVRALHAPLDLIEMSIDEPAAGEILVRLIAAGVAGRDLAAIAGDVAIPIPFVPGCEGAGIVERVGDGVATLAAGQAVMIVPRPASAPAAEPFASAEGIVHGFIGRQSTFATHLLCPADSAMPVAEGAPLEVLAGLGREALLGAGLVLAAPFGDAGSTTVVVTGADAVGLGACMAAAAVGIGRIVLCDPRAARRDLALTLGASVAVPAVDGLVSVVRSLDANGASYAIETSGRPAALAACREVSEPAGQFVQADEVALAKLDLGSLLPRLEAMIVAGSLPLERLVTFFPFERINEAVAALRNGTAVKPVLRFPVGPFGDLDRALRAGAAQEAEDPAANDGEPASQTDDGAPAVTA